MESQTGGQVAADRGELGKKAVRRDERMLKAAIRRGIVGGDTGGAICKRATTFDELEQAFALIYRIYRENQFIPSNDSHLRIRPFETSEDFAMFVAKRGNRVVGSLGSIVDSPDLGLPLDSNFHDEIEVFRNKDARLCEMTGQSIDSEFRGGGTCFELIQCCFSHLWLNRCTDIVCAVSPTSASFYKMVGFQQISEKRDYSDEVKDPVVVLRLSNIQTRWLDYKPVDSMVHRYWCDFFIHQNPYTSFVMGWDEQAIRERQDPAGMAELFGKSSELFANASERELEAIKRRIGEAYNLIVDVNGSHSVAA